MKTAEEVAEEISKWLNGICAHDPHGRCLQCQNAGIAQTLTAYGEAYGMKRHQDRDREVRAEALEEAAKVADRDECDYVGFNAACHCHSIPKAIRALKKAAK